MAKSYRPKDANQIAKYVVDTATSEPIRKKKAVKKPTKNKKKA